MGYYANGYGYFEVEKKDTIVDDFAKAMVGIEDATCNYELKLWEFGSAIGFFYNGKYHEEDVREVLDAIALLVKDGSMMEFTGEDDEHWAFVLECGNWVEKQGRIVYDISPNTDICFDGGHLIADRKMAEFLLGVLDFAGYKYDYDIAWVDEEEKKAYAKKAELCFELWHKIHDTM